MLTASLAGPAGKDSVLPNFSVMYPSSQVRLSMDRRRTCSPTLSALPRVTTLLHPRSGLPC